MTSQPGRAQEQPNNRRVVVSIATPIEPELVTLIRRVNDRLDLRYEPDLLPPPRFPCDHRGVDGFQRTDEQQERWRSLLGDAEVLFGLPGDDPRGLADVVRTNSRLRWVQGTAGGTGEQITAAGLTADELDRVLITSASGVHAGPLAEFVMFGVLAFAKRLPRLLADTRAQKWDHYPMSELAGQTLLVIGLGSIGTEVARLAKAFGMRVIAVNRTGHSEVSGVDQVRPTRFLGDLLPVAHAVVVTLPLTDQTQGLIDSQAISRMRADAVLVNVGRGGVVDEEALVRGLKSGQPAGAVLDVVATEPLPAASALWHLPNVLISPHTAALSVHENERIVALFAENLRRYLRGVELLSLVRPQLLY